MNELPERMRAEGRDALARTNNIHGPTWGVAYDAAMRDAANAIEPALNDRNARDLRAARDLDDLITRIARAVDDSNERTRMINVVSGVIAGLKDLASAYDPCTGIVSAGRS
jgi:hypothetical protein